MDGHPYKARNVQVRICQRHNASCQIVAEYLLLFHVESIWATDSLKIESIVKMECTRESVLNWSSVFAVEASKAVPDWPVELAVR